MTTSHYLSFVLTSLLFGLIPGPSVCFTVAHAIRHGCRRTMITALGQAAANALQLTVIVFGLGGILAKSVSFLFWVKLAGAAYLILLGLKTFLATEPDLSTARRGGRAGVVRDLMNGAIVCGTNPKALLYYAALLPQFVSSQGDSTQQLLLLGASSVLIAILVLSFYTFLAGQARRWLVEKGHWRAQARASGTLITAAGIWLAASASK